MLLKANVPYLLRWGPQGPQPCRQWWQGAQWPWGAAGLCTAALGRWPGTRLTEPCTSSTSEPQGKASPLSRAGISCLQCGKSPSRLPPSAPRKKKMKLVCRFSRNRNESRTDEQGGFGGPAWRQLGGAALAYLASSMVCCPPGPPRRLRPRAGQGAPATALGASGGRCAPMSTSPRAPQPHTPSSSPSPFSGGKLRLSSVKPFVCPVTSKSGVNPHS